MPCSVRALNRNLDKQQGMILAIVMVATIVYPNLAFVHVLSKGCWQEKDTLIQNWVSLCGGVWWTGGALFNRNSSKYAAPPRPVK